MANSDPKHFGGDIITYEHHGKVVSVREDLKGKHRMHCLCYDCKKFKPGLPEENCPIANMIYATCIALDVVTPVWECWEFERGSHYESTKVDKVIDVLIKDTEKPREPGTPDLCETVKPLVEHKTGCASFNNHTNGFALSVSDCDCGAIVG